MDKGESVPTLVGPIVVGRRGRAAVGGLLALVMVLGLAGCGSSKNSGVVLGGRTQKADIVVDRVDSLHQYVPNKVTIPLNRDVSFTVLNKDSIVHNVTVPALGIDIDIRPGERVEVKIPAVSAAPRDGFFLFYCKYHQSEGEAGRIYISK